MAELPNIKIVSNDLFEIFSDKQYTQDFIDRLVNIFKTQREKILKFFGLIEYPQIRINLFDDIEKLNNFSSKYIQISPYHKGDCCGDMINYFCNDEMLSDFSKAGYIIACLAHEFVHMIYHDKICGVKCVWIEEGLATYLSGQKNFLEQYIYRYKSFLLKMIYESEIPELDFLHKRGGKYGEFVDCDTQKYYGYDFSYGLVRYLIEKKGREYLNMIIVEEKALLKEEKTIIQDFIKYAKSIIDQEK